MADYPTECLFEHRFWLQILGEHAQFIYEGLGPTEVVEIAKAKQFADKFDALLALARQPLTRPELLKLSERAYRHASLLRAFKLYLLGRHMVGGIICYLTPSFLNHMVNETEEYLRILDFLRQGQVPPKLHPLDHHLLWLFDASFHTTAIPTYIDYTEKDITQICRAFEGKFQGYYLKAVEFAGYMRTKIEQFPALSRLNHQVNLEMRLFLKFLEELKELELSGELLSSFSAVLPDHLAREEYYYLLKLASVSDIPQPDGDPTRPRPNTQQK